MRNLRDFLTDLAERRPIRPFRARPHDDALIRTAITLRAAAPDAGAPSSEFVETLRDRLAAELAAPTEDPVPRGAATRRRVVSVAAASAVVGAVTGIVATKATNEPETRESEALAPTDGSWHKVAADADLTEGAVRRFDTGAVTGFLRRTDGQPHAVSGMCTHMGCALVLDTAQRVLNCPCHRSAFAVTGEVLHHQLPIDLPALPSIEVRENDGSIEVFVPRTDVPE